MCFPDATVKWAVTWWQRQVRTGFNGRSACPHGGRIILLSFYDDAWQHGKPTMLELCFQMNLGWLIPCHIYMYDLWVFWLTLSGSFHPQDAPTWKEQWWVSAAAHFSLTTRWHSMSAIAENVAFSQFCSPKQTHATNWPQNLLVCAIIASKLGSTWWQRVLNHFSRGLLKYKEVKEGDIALPTATLSAGLDIDKESDN